MQRFRLFISTGEVSGDLQAGLLIEALHQAAAERGWQLEIRALGGPRVAASGAQVMEQTAQMGAIGLVESMPYVYSAWQMQQRVRQAIQQSPPDLAVLIDYPGFNIALASDLKRLCPHCPVIYYIAPQEWVWALNQRTTRRIVAHTDEILAIFPQEAQYYAAHGAQTTWVGHPFADAFPHWPTRSLARQQLRIPEQQVTIALLPASRTQELRYILPTLAMAAQQIQHQIPNAHFWIPVALDTFREPLQAAIAQFGLRATLTDQSQLALAAADLVISKSGTANLEAALLEVPQIVIYRVHPVSGWLYRNLLRFRVPFISPVNLLQQTLIVPELLQEQATPRAIYEWAMTLLQSSEARASMVAQYRSLRDYLGEPGSRNRAAHAILNHLSSAHLCE